MWHITGFENGGRRRSRLLRALPGAAVAGLLLCVHAATNEPEPLDFEGHRLARSITIGDTRLELRGTGVLRVGLVFKGYAAALYLPPDVPSERVLDDVPKQLNIYYLHQTPASRMIETAERTMADNLTPEERSAVRARIDTLNSWKRDMPRGAVGSITYQPGAGTTFAVDGVPFITIEGADFAAAYFGVWFAAKPSSRSVKQQLLGTKP